MQNRPDKRLITGKKKSNRQDYMSEKSKWKKCGLCCVGGQGQPKILLLMSHCCLLISSVLDLCNTTTSVYNYGEITSCSSHSKRPFQRQLITKKAHFVCHYGSAPSRIQQISLMLDNIATTENSCKVMKWNIWNVKTCLVTRLKGRHGERDELERKVLFTSINDLEVPQV